MQKEKTLHKLLSVANQPSLKDTSGAQDQLIVLPASVYIMFHGGHISFHHQHSMAFKIGHGRPVGLGYYFCAFGTLQPKAGYLVAFAFRPRIDCWVFELVLIFEPDKDAIPESSENGRMKGPGGFGLIPWDSQTVPFFS